MSRPAMESIEEMFYSKSTEDEEQFRSKTVGLVSAETYKRHISSMRGGVRPEACPKKAKVRSETKARSGKFSSALSFEFDQDSEISDLGSGTRGAEGDGDNSLFRPDLEAEGGSPAGRQGPRESRDKCPRVDFGTIGKDQTIDTSFLPDKKRELEEFKERERLRREEFEEEEKLKQEIIEVVFSYWDGSGHRRSVRVPRNTTIGEFLEKCRVKLKSEFKEFSRLSSASLMYIKEDVILPHTITFHELIKTKARGKSGPLFHFNVFDDIREMSDVRKETTESHAGKVVKRQWYEKNKHVFPAYRWENYVPGKFNQPYSMRGD